MSTLYFAIGSMMNPISLKGRNLVPLESRPAELLDHKIEWFGAEGMATATPTPGESIHGVAHLMTEEDMLELDKIEMVYDRNEATCKYYDNSTT